MYASTSVLDSQKPHHLAYASSLHSMDFDDDAPNKKYASALHSPAFILAEAALSPAKYAIFQIVGYYFFRAAGYVDPAITALSTAKVGFIGGSVLAILYLILLLSSGRNREDDSKLETAGEQIRLLGQEMIFSTIAALIGGLVVVDNAKQHLSILVRAGMSGPVLSLVLLCVVLGIILAAIRVVRELQDRWIGQD
ncbi:hypothetical protein BDQ17DRAFT_1358456 [Cyathus striatus]|nr:hypothetical protein BDQ17DRAFT_1358456 [Cyathus striatus]